MSLTAAPAGSLPRGAAKLLALHWPLALLLAAVASVGFLMLYAAADGSFDPWARAQMIRFAVGFGVMIAIAMMPLRLFRTLAPVGYLVSLALLVAVDVMGRVGMGAQRWIALGPLQLQPSELMKLSLVLTLAAYYNRLPVEKVSRPLWVILPLLIILAPVGLVLDQPDLGTAILMIAGGGAVMFLAGVSLWYFGAAVAAVVGVVVAVFESMGTSWQLLHDYQFKRILTFLDPSTDPLGAGYHITQAKIAMGSGGLSGRGYMQGTQSRLNFLPEKHTDFIFTTVAEDFGFIGTASLLVLYALIITFCLASAMSNRDRFGALVTGGIAVTFFLLFGVNMAMVMGLMPVVGVPLPLVSYGGSAMLMLMAAFGLVQCAHVNRPRGDR